MNSRSIKNIPDHGYWKIMGLNCDSWKSQGDLMQDFTGQFSLKNVKIYTKLIHNGTNLCSMIFTTCMAEPSHGIQPLEERFAEP